MPIGEREIKMKHILTMSGMKTFTYWIGLFLADFLLFLGPTILFGILVCTINVEGYYEEVPRFIAISLGFGFSLIAFTYDISLVFKNAGDAVKYNIGIQLVLGTFLPLAFCICAGVVLSSNDLVNLLITLLFITNPFCTFYLANYQLILD